MHMSDLSSTPRSGLVSSLRAVPMIAVLSLWCAGLCGCTAIETWWHGIPDYKVTSHLYAEAPKRVVVLPFSAKPDKGGRIDVTERSAAVCRNTFYRHFSVRPFEDVELVEVDKRINAQADSGDPKPGRAARLANTVDVFGIRSLLSLHRLLKRSPWAAPEAKAEAQKLLKTFKADAYAIGATRDFGWWYAVIISSVKVACKVEVRSCKTGALLWKCEWKRRSWAHAVDTAFWSIPYRLIEVWRNTRGEVLENVTDRMFRDLARTIPYVERPVLALIVPIKPRVPLYKRPFGAFWNRVGYLDKGARIPLISAQPGWYRGMHPKLGKVYVHSDAAALRDEAGTPLHD